MLAIVFSVLNKRYGIGTSGQHTRIKNSIKKIVTQIVKENGKWLKESRRINFHTNFGVDSK